MCRRKNSSNFISHYSALHQGNLYRMEVDVKKRKRKDQSKPAASKPDGLECPNRSQMIALYLQIPLVPQKLLQVKYFLSCGLLKSSDFWVDELLDLEKIAAFLELFFQNAAKRIPLNRIGPNHLQIIRNILNFH